MESGIYGTYSGNRCISPEFLTIPLGILPNYVKLIEIGFSRFSEGLRSDRRDRDELNQREEVVFIHVFICNPLCDFFLLLKPSSLPIEMG